MSLASIVKKAFGKSEKTRTLTDAAKESLDKLKDEIENGGSFLPDKVQLPDPPSYDKMKGDESSDTDLEKKAEDSLKDYENNALNAIESENAAEGEKLANDKDSADKSAREKEQTLSGIYADAKKNTENDVLKRGLARSSIAVNQTAELEKSKAKALSDIGNMLSEQLQEIDSDLSSLALKRQKAIDDFNISLTVKLSEKIDALKETREKTNAEALKYNNELKAKESKDKTDKIKTESDLYSDALEQQKKETDLLQNEAAKQSAYKKSFEKMDALLSQVSPDEARSLVKDDGFFKNNLSEYLYYKLYEKYCR